MRLAANAVTDLRYIVQATTTSTMLAYVKRRPLARHRLEGDTGRGAILATSWLLVLIIEIKLCICIHAYVVP